MAVAAAARPAPALPLEAVEPARRHRAMPGRPTLEDVVLLATAALDAGSPVECVVCGGTMQPRGCDDCGAHLG